MSVPAALLPACPGFLTAGRASECWACCANRSHFRPVGAEPWVPSYSQGAFVPSGCSRGLERFHLLTALAKLILFNYLPGLSLNTFCVKFTVFPLSKRNGLHILVKI